MFKLNPNAKRRLSVYDMDGTIVDSLHRYKTIEGKIDLQYWRDNEYKSYSDKLRPMHKQYLRDLEDKNCIVIIATARVMRNTCDEFVRDKLGTPNAIISRKDGDTRGGAALKIKGLNKLFNLKGFQNFNSMVVYEDNVSYLKSICDYYPGSIGVYVPSEQGH
jgi:hypothetical protein